MKQDQVIEAEQKPLEPIDITSRLASASNGHQEPQVQDTSAVSLASILEEQITPLLQEQASVTPDMLSQYLTSIDKAYASLILDAPVRESIYPQMTSSMVEYVRQCIERIPDYRSMGTSRRALSSLHSQGKRDHKQCIATLKALLLALKRDEKLKLTNVATHTALEDVSKALTRIRETITPDIKIEDSERQDAQAAPDTDTSTGSKIPQATQKLLAAIASMPDEEHRNERMKLAYHRRFIWTRNRICKFLGSELSSRVTELWLARFEMNRIVNVWEPSEAVDGLLIMEDRRYFATVYKDDKRQDIEISRKDAHSLKPTWPNQLHIVAQPNEKAWPQLTQFFDEVATVCDLPRINHYSSSGLLRNKEENTYSFAAPNGGAITVGGWDETGLVTFPVQYQDRLGKQPYQFFDGDEKDVVSDFRLWMKARNVAPKTTEIAIAMFGELGLAPLSQLITPANLLIHGRSQSKKSTLVRLFLQACTYLFGRDSEWCSFNMRESGPTDYYIEQCAYYLAGLPLLLDDGLKGKATPKQVEHFYQTWSKFLSYSLTGEGRGRGKPGRYGDGGVSKNWHPRSPMIATVEGLPRPQDQASTLARCAMVMLDGPDCIDMPLLNELQEEASARAMNRSYTRFIRWLLLHVDDARELVNNLIDAWADGTLTYSPRLQGTYAKLEAGATLLYQYGREIGALTEQEYTEYKQHARDALISMAKKQADLLNIADGTAQEMNPVEQFKRCLSKALDSQKLCLTDSEKAGNPKVYQCPKNLPEDFDEKKVGWTLHNNQTGFERKNAYAAGILHKRGERGGTYPWTWRVQAAEWDKVYPYIEKAAEDESFVIPGSKAMLGILEEERLAKKSVRTNMWDGSRDGKCHLIDMTWYIEGEPDPEPDDHAPGNEQAKPIVYGNLDV